MAEMHDSSLDAGRGVSSAPPHGDPRDASRGEAALIQVKGLRFSYGNEFTLEIDAFTLRAQSRVAIVGRNGSGKTTWLRLLAGLEQPAACEAFVRAPKIQIGFLRQNPYLFSGTVAQNLAYPLKLRRLSHEQIAVRIGAMLDRVELALLADRRCDELSGGERKRLALGRTLIGDPNVLFLDEPDAHLDRRSQRVIEMMLTGLEATVLFTTHDLRFAHRVAGEIHHLRDGRMTPGVPENILAGWAGELPRGARDEADTLRGQPTDARSELHVSPDRVATSMTTPGGLRIMLAHPVPAGPVKIAVDPTHLVLSREPFDSSMLNQLRGRIAAVHDENGNVWLEIAVADETLTAIISRSSYERLGLNLAHDVVVSFKANAVEVL
jgi:molybdopterin-binding protein